MKAVFYLAITILVSSAYASDTINGETLSFLLGTWFSFEVSIPDSPDDLDCCAPLGTLTFVANKTNDTQILLSATKWAGKLCAPDQMNISNDNRTYIMQLPIPTNSTFDELSFEINMINDLGVGFTFSDGDFSRVYENKTQAVLFDFGVDYIQTNTTIQGRVCSIKLSKKLNAGSILQIAGAGVIAFIALFVL